MNRFASAKETPACLTSRCSVVEFPTTSILTGRHIITPVGMSSDSRRKKKRRRETRKRSKEMRKRRREGADTCRIKDMQLPPCCCWCVDLSRFAFQKSNGGTVRNDSGGAEGRDRPHPATCIERGWCLPSSLSHDPLFFLPQTIVYVLKEHTEMLRGVRQVCRISAIDPHCPSEGYGCDERNGRGAQEPSS
jgi:hypothetical protein